jgi:NodT family efflux transporter outer membrane factor (OMF) lipoprotein
LLRRPARLLALLLVAAGPGCAVGPDYRRPELATPEAWHAQPGAAPGAAEADAALAAWWERFGDAQLSALVARAARESVELRFADARVRELVALRGVAGASLWPQLDAVGEAAFISGPTENSALGALEAFWELDVFGGLRRAVEASEADLGAGIEDRRALLLALVGSVATTYVELRGLESELATVRRNLDAQQETHSLTEAQRRAGLASDLDVERARAQMSLTAAELQPLESARTAARNRLAVLMGAAPGALDAELGDEAPIPSAPAEVVTGVPADLLRRRPDLVRAERELAAATARIGEAEAERWPRFTLVGSVGLRSDDVAKLVAGDGAIASIGPSVTWPIFAAGRIRANIAANDARTEQALARYELALLRALEEAENALDRHAREQLRRVDLRDAVAANRQAVELAQRLYANGLGGFLDVLVAQRLLLEAESRLVASETAVSTSLVSVYVALGGGWQQADALRLP